MTIERLGLARISHGLLKVLLAVKLALLQYLDLKDSRYLSKRAAVKYLDGMGSHQIVVSLGGEMLTHTLTTSLPLICLPFLHEVIDPSFFAIITSDGKVSKFVNDVSRIHVCDGDGAILGTRDQVPTRVQRYGLGQVLARRSLSLVWARLTQYVTVLGSSC